MVRYVAFLRAINVGGNSQIRMDVLRDLFENAGFDNVRTYIASGNVLFNSEETDSAKVQTIIEAFLEKQMGKHIDVFVRTTRDIKTLVKKDPFRGETDDNIRRYVTFFYATPDIALTKTAECEIFSVKDGLVCSRVFMNKGRFGNLAKAFGKEATKGTTRDWDTVKAIAKLG